MWTSHDQFLSAVGDFWGNLSISGHPVYIMMTKLKLLRSFLRNWNKNTFGHVDSSKAKQSLISVQQEIEIHGFSDALHRQELDANMSLSLHLAHQESLLKDKSRVNWLTEGDRNSKFYHALLTRRRAQSTGSSILINRVLVEDASVINSHVLDYFSHLFTFCSLKYMLEIRYI